MKTFPWKRFFFLFLLISTSALAASAPRVTINLDATEAPRKIFHVRMQIPASPGTLTFYYPKWIPGEHGPTGPIEDLAGLKFFFNGQPLKWRRDLQDGWTFHVEVPTGATSIDATLDFISPAGQEGIYTAGHSATEKMAVISWNTMLLYPAGYASDDLIYESSVKLPAGWKFATSLPIASQSGSEIKFKPISLTMLVDGPVLAGEYLKMVPLSEGDLPVELDVAADSGAALDAPPEIWQEYKNLIVQAGLLFGARHYRVYHFLFSLSDHVAHFGLEHHESNDSRVDERGLVDPRKRLLDAGLLPHEYVHSWNGKYRRPADLATPDYEKPMQTDLLWVYEGLTSYLGDVLSARSGIRTPAEFRDALAYIAADLDHRPGRTWRNLQDTADGVPSMQYAPPAWRAYRRPLDYYEEDVLTWLAADVVIQQQTKGAKSLDDFCKLFHGGESTPPMVKTYTFDDVVNGLNQIAPYDWRNFWTRKLESHGSGAPLDGIEGSGWKLVYDDQRSDQVRAYEDDDSERVVNAAYSIGLWLKDDGLIVDTVEGMLAPRMGIGPGMRLIAVNGKKFNAEVLRDVLRAAKNNSAPIELLIENTDYYRTFKLDYHAGEKYPHLVRDESKNDLLGEIIKAR